MSKPILDAEYLRGFVTLDKPKPKGFLSYLWSFVSSDEPNNEPKNEPNDLVEAYVLYKVLGSDRYSNIPTLAHHICLLKSRDGKFYYTDLNPNEGNSSGACSKLAPIKLQFERYEFYAMNGNNCIWYKPLGKIQLKFKEMQHFVDNHASIGTTYRLLISRNNCQVYVTSCIEFLKPKNDVKKISLGKTFTSSDYIYGVLDPSEIRLDPPQFMEHGGIYLKDTWLTANATMFYVGDQLNAVEQLVKPMLPYV